MCTAYAEVGREEMMPEVTINGPEVRIEGRYLHAPEPNAPIALMLHPHPQHGGTMNNKVVYSMYQTFVARGFSTLRFNFRGVGRSQGSYTGGEGELSDAATALDWLQTYNPNAKYCWIGCFSFGAWIGMQLLMRRPEITGFVSIAPPANMFDFTFLATCPASGIMVQGDQDDIVTPESVKKLVDKLSAQRGITITHTVINGANHFFGQQIDQLTDIVGTYLDKSIAAHDKASA